jgi:hypothetical protein
MLARLSVMVSIPTTRRLERLAAYDGVTQREMPERALAGAERQVLEPYGARCRKMTSNGGPLPPITRGPPRRTLAALRRGLARRATTALAACVALIDKAREDAAARHVLGSIRG